MSATVIQVPPKSGNYYLRVRKKGKTKDTKMSASEANKLAKRINSNAMLVNLGIIEEEKKVPTFEEYGEIWLKTFIRPPLRAERTYSRYQSLLGVIKPSIRKTPLSEITRGDIKKELMSYYRSGKDGKSKRSVEILKNVMSGVFTCAIDDEIVNVNPTNGIMKRLNLPASNHEISPLSLGESQELLDLIAKISPEYHSMFLFLFRTGCRVGEAQALHWQDVDLEKGSVKIKRTAKDQRITDKPKTASSRREVELSPEIMHVLEDMHTKYRKSVHESKKKIPGIVFRTRDNRLLSQQTLSRVFHKNLNEAGMERRRVHDIRHSYASILLSAGVPAIYVSRQMGHASIRITIDTYGHWIKDNKNSYVKMLDNRE